MAFYTKFDIWMKYPPLGRIIIALEMADEMKERQYLQELVSMIQRFRTS